MAQIARYAYEQSAIEATHSKNSRVSVFEANRTWGETLPRFNWLIVPGQAIAARGKHQPRCQTLKSPRSAAPLIAVEFPLEHARRRLPNGNGRMPVDVEAWRWLQQVQLHGEPISDCIIRVIIITLHQRGCRNSNVALCASPNQTVSLEEKLGAVG